MRGSALITCACLCAAVLVIPLQHAACQEPAVSYESKFIETRGVRLHYLEFGGSGLPILFVQSFHGDAREWVDYDFVGFAPRFVDDFRVFAVTRRGWGESDDMGWGYDVATQSEDLIGFMDALGIRRAVLVGRIPANQDMTWIAEHYPDRVAGLVYLGNPYVFPDYRNAEVRAFDEHESLSACDLGEEALVRTSPRAPWRPHFLYDEAARIDIPALRFVLPDRPVHSLWRLDRVIAWAATGQPLSCDPAAQEYFAALVADERRIAALRRALAEADPSIAVNDAMERAFGTNLRTEEDSLGDLDGTMERWYVHMRSFLEDVMRVEATRGSSPNP
jgi:pimeloyl-ACP methyl ester carboxylesterase